MVILGPYTSRRLPKKCKNNPFSRLLLLRMCDVQCHTDKLTKYFILFLCTILQSTGRCEIMNCLQKILQGMGSAVHAYHKEIYKVTRNALQDRSMAVRCATANVRIHLKLKVYLANY